MNPQLGLKEFSGVHPLCSFAVQLAVGKKNIEGQARVRALFNFLELCSTKAHLADQNTKI
jgi:hypothetical protein